MGEIQYVTFDNLSNAQQPNPAKWEDITLSTTEGSNRHVRHKQLGIVKDCDMS